MGLVASRMRLLERELARRAMVQGVALALASVLAYLALFNLLGANIALLGFGTVAVTPGAARRRRGWVFALLSPCARSGWSTWPPWGASARSSRTT